MSAVLPALIAVAGTLLGSGVTFFIQRSIADRAASHAMTERLRQDRLNAYNAFADAAVEYRGAEYDRWFRLQEGEDGATRPAIQAAHSKRSTARSALIRIALLTNDPRLQELGSEAIQVTRSISHASSPEQREERGDQAKALLDAFIKHAAADVQTSQLQPQPPTGVGPELNR